MTRPPSGLPLAAEWRMNLVVGRGGGEEKRVREKARTPVSNPGLAVTAEGGQRSDSESGADKMC